MFTKSSDNKYTLYKSVGNGGSLTNITPSKGLDFNEISLYLNRGIAKRSEKVGEIDFSIIDKNGEEIEDHYLNDLLDNPSKQYTGDQFWNLANKYRDATGFVVMKKITDGEEQVFDKGKREKRVTELKIYNSSRIKVNLNTNQDEVTSFTYTSAGGGTEVIKYDDAIYWYNPDPKNPLLGIPLMTAGVRAITSDLAITEHQASVIKNGGVVDSILTFKNVPNAESLAKIKKDYIREYGAGTSNGSPMVLGGDTKYERLGLSPQEMSFVESRQLLIDDIVVITSVPKVILGVTAGETFANAETGYAIFLRETIAPIIKDLANVLNWKLAPSDATIVAIDPTPKNKEENLAELKAGHDSNSLTLNEKRHYLGKEPIEGGDERPNKPAEQPVVAPKEEKTKAGVFVHPLRNKAFRNDYYTNYVKSVQSKERSFKTSLKKYFKEQEERILSNISSRKQVKIKGIEDDIFNESLEVDLTLPLLRDMEEISKEVGQETMDIFAGNKDFVYTSDVASAVDKRYAFFSKSINATTAKAVKKEVTQWLAKEETINQLKERMKGVYNTIDDSRLTTIALTESQSIAQLSKMATYKQIGIQTKIWVWSAGAKGGVRDEHASIDGEERPMGTPFSNGMMYPQDPNFGADENVNCLCTI